MRVARAARGEKEGGKDRERDEKKSRDWVLSPPLDRLQCGEREDTASGIGLGGGGRSLSSW